MELFIGKQIREFRKANKMTQEQLAELAGVSFQAVSKWENDIALPDITLVAKLNQIFGVTIDELFSYNLKEIQEDIMRYARKSAELRESDPQKARSILEEGLQKYPEDDILLNNLLYVLNYSKNPDETIRIANRLIDKTAMNDVKYDALRFLAYAYIAKGDSTSAQAALEQLPELYFTKLSEMAFILTGALKYEAAEKQKWISFEILLQMMQKIAECYEAEGETAKAISETYRALALIQALEGEEKISRFANYVDFYKNQLKRLQNPL